MNQQQNNSFKIKGYTSGISFLYSNWTYAFLLVVQLVALGFFSQGLLIYFQYDTYEDWRIALLWSGAVISTVSCIFISISTFANNSNLFKFSLIFVCITLIASILDIALLVTTKNANIKDLEYCSLGKSVEPSTCTMFWGQKYCGIYIFNQCTQLFSGFKKLMLSQAAVSLVQTFLIGFSILKLFRESKNSISKIPYDNTNNRNNNNNFKYHLINNNE